MSLRLLLTIAGVVGFVFGFGLVLFPSSFMGSFGITLDPTSQFITKGMGAILLGLGLMNLAIKNITDTKVLREVARANLVVHVLGFGTMVSAIQSGLVNSNGWGDVVMHVLFAVGFSYYTLKKEVK